MDNTPKIDPYEAYQADPSPENLVGVVDSLKPTIEYSLRSLGAASDPYMRSHARTVAAKSIQSFDPTKSQLQTHVSTQLKRLYRDYRARRSPVPVPERIQQDRFHLVRHEEEFLDKHDREPTTEELSDLTGLPMRRIQKLRDNEVAINTEATLNELDIAPKLSEVDWDREAIEYVYSESDTLDKKILEGKMGLYGSAPRSNKELMRQLKLQPHQLSRRSIRLSKRINEIVNDLKR
jgi:hypothetical protein